MKKDIKVEKTGNYPRGNSFFEELGELEQVTRISSRWFRYDF
jgi:hypothetical protein